MYGTSTYGSTAYGASFATTLPTTPVDPGTPYIPSSAPQIFAATIMRRSIINLTASLGPAAINLIARLP